jgi:hypothetical protein
MAQSVFDIVHVFKREIDVNIHKIHLCDVFVGEALIVEFRDIKKRILHEFLTFLDGLEISNGLVWVLQWVLLEKMKMSRCHWKVLE